jgi:hypothetical protein
VQEKNDICSSGKWSTRIYQKRFQFIGVVKKSSAQRKGIYHSEKELYQGREESQDGGKTI